MKTEIPFVACGGFSMPDEEFGILLKSTGRTIYPCGGIVGLSETGEAMSGSDGFVDGYGSGEDLTPLEKIDLAEVMRDRWLAYMNRARVQYFRSAKGSDSATAP